MPFDFIHRPSRKRGRNPWYENALLLAVAGSIIAVIGQLSGTIIPIMYGPADISDFSLSAWAIHPVILLPNDRDVIDYAEVKVEDFHRYLRPYRFSVYLQVQASELPPGVSVYFFTPEEIKPGGFSNMSIKIKKGTKEMDLPIRVQGLGGDGKKRNATFHLFIRHPNQPLNLTVAPYSSSKQFTSRSLPNINLEGS